MSTVVPFSNKQAIEPGAYTQVLSGIPVPAALGTFGNIVIIDDGLQAGTGYGSGVNGELKQGVSSVYQFTDRDTMKAAVRSGRLWDVMDYLWSPADGAAGPNAVYLVQAATTTAAFKVFTFVGAAAAPAGAVKIAAKSEGVGANGTLVGSVCTRGYAAKLRAGVVNASAFIMDFYEGQYRGADSDTGAEFDTAEANVRNNIITSSTEFTNVNQLLAWMQMDSTFNNYFTVITAGTTASAVAMVAGNLTTYTGIQVFAGGTTVYNAADFDAALDSVADLDNSMFLSLNYGITPTVSPTSQQLLDGVNKGAICTNNDKLLAHINTDATYTEKCMYVAGGSNANEYDYATSGSLQIARYFNSALAVAVHSGVYLNYKVNGIGNGFRPVNALYHAAMVCGLIAGLEPQVPGTYKPLRIKGLIHELKPKQRVIALQSGLLHTRQVAGKGYVINQAINTIQQNTLLINPDGTSEEISIMRIVHQINKELKINGTARFVGGNQFSAGDAEIKAFTEDYLQLRSVDKAQGKDGLIMKGFNVTVVTNADSKFTKYCFYPNGPTNKLFFTGYMMDPKIQG